MNIPSDLLVFMLSVFAAIVGGLFTIATYLIKKMFTGLENKIVGFCTDNRKDHGDMWKMINHHQHTCCDDKNPKVVVVE